MMQLRRRDDPYAADAVPTPWQGWGLAAYGGALALAGVVAYFLLGLPLQVSDNIANLITVNQQSYWELLQTNGVTRPLLWVTLKLATDLSGGQYFTTFRAIQIVQVAVLLVLVVRACGVRAPHHAAAALLAICVLLGFHTFHNLVREAYPINTYLSLLVYLAIGLNLLLARPGWAVDAAAAVLIAIAALTVETGVLIWVALVAGYLAGFRGVSSRGLIAATIVALVYVGFRFPPLDAGPKMLTQAPTGYGFRVLERQEVEAIFGANPLPFYLNNVGTSVATVLFAEPRRGAWVFTASVLRGEWRYASAIGIATTTATTLLMLALAAGRVRRWLKGDIPPLERWLLVFVAVLLGNATISFAYTKDDIMSPAGMVYALAAYGTAATLLQMTSTRLRASAILAVPLLLAGIGWSIRVVDLPYLMVRSGVINRVDWARVEDWKRANDFDSRYTAYAPMVEAMQREALAMHVPHPFQSMRMRWWDRWYSAP